MRKLGNFVLIFFPQIIITFDFPWWKKIVVSLFSRQIICDEEAKISKRPIKYNFIYFSAYIYIYIHYWLGCSHHWLRKYLVEGHIIFLHLMIQNLFMIFNELCLPHFGYFFHHFSILYRLRFDQIGVTNPNDQGL